MSTPKRIDINGTGQFLDAVQVDQGLGPALRETVVIADAKPAVAGPQRKAVPPRRKSSVKPDTGAPIQLDFPLLLSPIREQPTLQDLIQDLAPLPRLPAAQFSPRVYHRVATVYSIAAAREKRQSRRRRAAAFLLLAA